MRKGEIRGGWNNACRRLKGAFLRGPCNYMAIVCVCVYDGQRRRRRRLFIGYICRRETACARFYRTSSSGGRAHAVVSVLLPLLFVVCNIISAYDTARSNRSVLECHHNARTANNKSRLVILFEFKEEDGGKKTKRVYRDLVAANCGQNIL